MKTQNEKSAAFCALHERSGAFVIPNPWDVGSAKLLEREGFEALATSSAGCAFALGRRDNNIGREMMLAHSTALIEATDLPISADLENGFGDTPEIVAETIRLAAAAGLVGGSIEDADSAGSDPIYPLEKAADRIRAACDAARSLDIPFMVTGRAENYLFGRADIADTVARLQAYQEAGADVLYAPGVSTPEDISAIVSSVDRPINVLMGVGESPLTADALAKLGVKRISTGSALARAAYGALIRAAHELGECGTFGFVADAVPFAELNAMFPGTNR
jgi:2-methylisocitrate lyase-like PEP mutase family enzyme